jgi:hypothetical protein
MRNIRSYSELMRIPSFKERFEYLKISAKVGDPTFGSRRFLNQEFYRSQKWKSIRNQIIVRDDGCDIAHEDYPINGRIYIHHLNPITLEDIETMSHCIFDPENLICVSFDTHNAIHYGDENLLRQPPPIRLANDTCPWKT